jgi:hypothetical protein
MSKESEEKHIEKHIEKHKITHGVLDVLVAEFLDANPNKFPSETSIYELMVWSYHQTLPKKEKRHD